MRRSGRSGPRDDRKRKADSPRRQETSPSPLASNATPAPSVLTVPEVCAVDRAALGLRWRPDDVGDRSGVEERRAARQSDRAQAVAAVVRVQRGIDLEAPSLLGQRSPGGARSHLDTGGSWKYQARLSAAPLGSDGNLDVRRLLQSRSGRACGDEDRAETESPGSPNDLRSPTALPGPGDERASVGPGRDRLLKAQLGRVREQEHRPERSAFAKRSVVPRSSLSAASASDPAPTPRTSCPPGRPLRPG